MLHNLIAEFLSTGLMILFGVGVHCDEVLTNTKYHGSGHIFAITTWAFGISVCLYIFGGVCMNPAMVLAQCVLGMLPWTSFIPYVIAEFLGALVGALICYVMYKDHFTATEEEGLKRACFCTEPAIRNYPINLVNEIVGTFVLVFVIFYLAGANITLPGTAESTPIGLGSIGALPVAILVWAIGLSLGGTTGSANNPARDLGPRLTLGLFLGGTLKTKADWGYSWVPVIGPFIGAALAAVFYNAIM